MKVSAGLTQKIETYWRAVRRQWRHEVRTMGDKGTAVRQREEEEEVFISSERNRRNATSYLGLPGSTAERVEVLCVCVCVWEIYLFL